MKARIFTVSLVVVSSWLFACPLFAGAAATSSNKQDCEDQEKWEKRVECWLKSHYRVSPDRLVIGGRRHDVVPGDELAIQRAGIMGNLVDPDQLSRLQRQTPTVVYEGDFVQVGGGDMSSAQGARSFKVDETVYLSERIGVHSGTHWLKGGCGWKDSDCIKVIIFSAQPVETNIGGTTRSRRYGARVTFLYDEGFLESATFPEILEGIHPFLKSVDEVANEPPKTVSLGQSPDEVEASFGKPKQVIDLGPKKIFVYDSIKVIFMDGKVSDVQ